jgi:GDPmannose 4,6-dehydratase
VDSRYFRPTEVDSLLGDATKARERLGWQPKTGFEDLVAEMMREDYRAAQRDSMVKRHGYRVAEYQE